MSGGTLVVSLDLELLWGVRDSHKTFDYWRNLEGERLAIRGMLRLFEEYGVHATWATVGAMLLSSIDEVCALFPLPRHGHHRETYGYLTAPHARLIPERFLFGRDIVREIVDVPGQEIGCHTFSHMCALESGNGLEEFRMELAVARSVAARDDIKVTSFVFPRNQYSGPHLEICREHGFTSYRGSVPHPLYSPRQRSRESLALRASRRLDAAVPITGSRAYGAEALGAAAPVNVAASQFLYPVAWTDQGLGNARRARIAADLRDAAIRGLTYHLWWHPHNFGKFPTANLTHLRKILEAYCELRNRFGMTSLNMQEIAAERLSGRVGGCNHPPCASQVNQ